MTSTSTPPDAVIVDDRFGAVKPPLLGAEDWWSAADRTAFPVRNPATDAVLAWVPSGSAADAGAAVGAAERALVGWRATTAEARSSLLRRTTWSSSVGSGLG